VLKIVEAFLKLGLQHIECFFLLQIEWRQLGWWRFFAQLHRCKFLLGIGFFWFGVIQMTWFAFCVRGCLQILLSMAVFIALFYKPIFTKSFFFSFFSFLGFFFSFFNITSPISAPWKTAPFLTSLFCLLVWVLFASAGWLALLVRERIPYTLSSLSSLK